MLDRPQTGNEMLHDIVNKQYDGDNDDDRRREGR